MFKGSSKTIPITIYNDGDTDAVDPLLKCRAMPGEVTEAYKWKGISFDEKQGFSSELQLKTIKADSKLRGAIVRVNDFSGYPPIAGIHPGDSWTTYPANSQKDWEIYNGWLQHNPALEDGRAVWRELPEAKDFELQFDLSVEDGTYAGCILRDVGNSDTGYIVLVQGQRQWLSGVRPGEGVVQIFSGTFSQGIASWGDPIYQSPSIGTLGVRIPFKVSLEGHRFSFWYKNTEGEPMFSFDDTDDLYIRPSRPVICCHSGIGSSTRLLFDNVKMVADTEDGVIWLKNEVQSNTDLYGVQRSAMEITYGDASGGAE